ncbi:MAG: hypothetical protein Q4A12_08145 [Eubacteriales bacterium]|nr:hypothetical protein [Eubacteriales bacterium]
MKIINKFVAVTLIFIMIVLLTACGNKTPKTADEFTSFMESKGFTVADSTLFAQTIITADTVLTALNDNYEIDFYVLSSDTGASSLFELNKSAFESDGSTVSETTNISSDNYNYYDNISDTGFRLTARVDNTVLYCYTDAEYKDEIIDIITELGYK